MDSKNTIRIDMIVEDGDKKQKVINLNRTDKIILNKSYLQSITEDSKPPTSPALKNLKRSNLFLIGSNCKEDINTFFPVRVQFTEKSIRLNLNSKFQKSTVIIPPKKKEDTACLQLNENDVQKVMKEVLTSQLNGQTYDHLKCKSTSTELSIAIHDRLKVMGHDAYKIAVDVFIGEIRGDGIETATQCVWNPTSDCVVSAYYKNSSLMATATVFASYCN